MSGQYVTGTTVKITLTFTDDDDVAVDPGVVKAYILVPDGTVTEYVYGTDPELTKSVTGIYELLHDLAIDAAIGKYIYGGRGSGTYNVTASSGKFYVEDWPFD